MACDTLKTTEYGTGLPIPPKEREFLTAVAEAATAAQCCISEDLAASIACANEYAAKKKAYEEYISWREASKVPTEWEKAGEKNHLGS